VSLGRYRFGADGAFVEMKADRFPNYVVAEAVRFVPVPLTLPSPTEGEGPSDSCFFADPNRWRRSVKPQGSRSASGGCGEPNPLSVRTR